MKKNRRNNLDEMQNQKLMKLEEYGFWGMFWALLTAIVIQLITGGTIRNIAGEIIVLLIGSIFICAATLKNGIWTRQSTPTKKGNAGTSIFPAIAVGILNAIKISKNGQWDSSSILIMVVLMVVVYIACFSILELFRMAYNKQRSKLDDINDESEE